MKKEIHEATEFISKNFIKSINTNTSTHDLHKIKDTLREILEERYKDHWYESKPLKGQAYRCIRLRKQDTETLDYVIDTLIKRLKKFNIFIENNLCKNDITLWVDPGEVSCRYGDGLSNTFIIAQFEINNTRTESTSSSSSSTATPPPPPSVLQVEQQQQQSQLNNEALEQDDEIFEFLTPALNDIQTSLSSQQQLEVNIKYDENLKATPAIATTTTNQIANLISDTPYFYSCSPSSYSTTSSSSICSNTSDGTRTPISVYGDSERSDTPSTTASTTQSVQNEQDKSAKEKTYCGYVESYPYYYKLNRLYNALAIQKMQSERLKKQILRTNGTSKYQTTNVQQPSPSTTPSPMRVIPKQQHQQQQRPHSYHQSQPQRLSNAIQIPNQRTTTTGVSPSSSSTSASTSPAANFLYHHQQQQHQQQIALLQQQQQPQMSTITSNTVPIVVNTQQQVQQQQNTQQNGNLFDPMNWIRGTDLIKSKN